MEHILANPEKVAPVRHRAAVPVADLPAAFQQIAAIDGQSARARALLPDLDRRAVWRGARHGVERGRSRRRLIGHSL